MALAILVLRNNWLVGEYAGHHSSEPEYGTGSTNSKVTLSFLLTFLWPKQIIWHCLTQREVKYHPALLLEKLSKMEQFDGHHQLLPHSIKYSSCANYLLPQFFLFRIL